MLYAAILKTLAVWSNSKVPKGRGLVGGWSFRSWMRFWTGLRWTEYGRCQSPVGRALIGARIGDEVEVVVGDREWTVVDLI